VVLVRASQAIAGAEGSCQAVSRPLPRPPAFTCATRYATLPRETLRVSGESICAAIRGLPFESCFDLQRTGANSFRGSLAGMSFAFCQFTKEGDRPGTSCTGLPLSIQPTAASSTRP